MNPALRAVLLSPAFTPKRLYQSADLGDYWEPGASAFQDSAGVTASVAGQPLGLVLSQRYGLSPSGANLINDGTFDSGLGSWAVGPGGGVASVVAGRARIANSSSVGNDVRIGRSLTGLTLNAWYVATVDAYVGTAPGVSLGVTENSNLSGGIAHSTTATGPLRVIFLASATTMYMRLVANGSITNDGTYSEYDNVVVTRLTGDHARQTTSAARPTLQAGNWADFDVVDDAMVSSFASSLGTACTVFHAVPTTGATILTGQSLTTSLTNSTDAYCWGVINRALTGTETDKLTRYLNRKAGV